MSSAKEQYSLFTVTAAESMTREQGRGELKVILLMPDIVHDFFPLIQKNLCFATNFHDFF